MARTLEPPPTDETELRGIAERAALASGAKRVILFDSVARGEAKPDSDIDLLLVLDDGLTRTDITVCLIAADTAASPRWYSLDLVPMFEADFVGRCSILSRAVHSEGRTLFPNET